VIFGSSPHDFALALPATGVLSDRPPAFISMKIHLGMVDFHGSSESLACRIERGKRNSILQQAVADLPGQAKAGKAAIRRQTVAKMEPGQP
jgi:hypothetical protein